MSTILVVDDEEEVRSFVRDVLQEAGHDTIESVDGIEGLNAFRAHHPDLVITDIFMPRQGGLGFVRGLRNEFGDVPIIAMSGGSLSVNGDFLDVAKNYGVKATLRKPFSTDDLIAVVEMVFAELVTA